MTARRAGQPKGSDPKPEAKVETQSKPEAKGQP